jgi:TPP-dependent 2-oxoacid decarboxylase
MAFKASQQSNSSVSINQSQLTIKDREMISLSLATLLIKLNLKFEREHLERQVVLLEEIKTKIKTSNSSRAAQVGQIRML